MDNLYNYERAFKGTHLGIPSGSDPFRTVSVHLEMALFQILSAQFSLRQILTSSMKVGIITESASILDILQVPESLRDTRIGFDFKEVADDGTIWLSTDLEEL